MFEHAHGSLASYVYVVLRRLKLFAVWSAFQPNYIGLEFISGVLYIVGCKRVSASSELFAVGFVLVLLGILILISALVLAATRSRKSNVKSAGIIVIGPVPIIFGSDKRSIKTVLVLATILTALSVVVMLFYYFLSR